MQPTRTFSRLDTIQLRSFLTMLASLEWFVCGLETDSTSNEAQVRLLHIS